MKGLLQNEDFAAASFYVEKSSGSMLLLKVGENKRTNRRSNAKPCRLSIA